MLFNCMTKVSGYIWTMETLAAIWDVLFEMAQGSADGDVEWFHLAVQGECMQPAVDSCPTWTCSYMEHSPFRLQMYTFHS